MNEMYDTGCPHCRTGESGYSVFQESCEARIAQVRKIVKEVERSSSTTHGRLNESTII